MFTHLDCAGGLRGIHVLSLYLGQELRRRVRLGDDSSALLLLHAARLLGAELQGG